MWRPDVSRYEKLNPLKDCWYDNTCVEAVKNGYKWATGRSPEKGELNILFY